MQPSQRIFGLDAMRAWAIVSVVIMHGGSMLEGTFLQNFPFVRMIDGVDIFFALSGYLIGKILLKEINRGEEFTTAQLLGFWKRRWFRTLPSYYLILAANYVVVKYGIIHEYISVFNWKFLVFLQNFNEPFMGFFWESWTLTIEEWFYIFAPVLLWVLLKFARPKTAFLLTTLVMIAAPFLHRASIYSPGIDMTQWSEIYRKLVINRLDSIAYGLLAAWLFYYCPRQWHSWRYYSFFAGFGLMYFILHYESDITTVYAQVIQLALSPLCAALMLPLAESIKTGRGWFGKAITHISVVSYSMYLINGALVSEVIRDNFAPTTTADRLLKYALYWLVVIVGASLLYRFFEKPIMDLRDKPFTLKSWWPFSKK